MTMFDEDQLSITLTDALDQIALPADGPTRILEARDRLGRPARTLHRSGPLHPTRDQAGDRPEDHTLATAVRGQSRLGSDRPQGPLGSDRPGGLLTSGRRRILVGAAAAVVIVAGAVGATHLGGGSRATVATQSAPPHSLTHPAAGTAGKKAGSGRTSGRTSTALAAPASGAAAGPTSSSGSTSGTPAAPVSPPVTTAPPGGGTASVPPLPSQVIQTGSVSVRVARGDLQTSLDRLGSLATGLGGFVQSSSSQGSGKTATGSATLRVPTAQFDQLLAQVKQLGRTLAVTTSGQDVTAQDVDLSAQIQALQATRTQYLQILAKAESIADILSVEEQITPVESQIEQLQGQQQVLENQATYGTLAVDLSETPAKKTPPPKPATTSGFTRAWTHARHSFTHGLESVVSALGGIAVFALCALALGIVAGVGWRVLRRRLV
jgi:hypothetical protein